MKNETTYSKDSNHRCKQPKGSHFSLKNNNILIFGWCY